MQIRAFLRERLAVLENPRSIRDCVDLTCKVERQLDADGLQIEVAVLQATVHTFCLGNEWHDCKPRYGDTTHSRLAVDHGQHQQIGCFAHCAHVGDVSCFVY